MIKRIPVVFAVVVSFFVGIAGQPGAAQERKISYIRDAEIEHIIRSYADPLFQAAGLEPSAIKLFLVKDNSLNAFVAAGQNLFIHTGLLMRADNASQVIGVIAHETGHIAAGHLIRAYDALDDAFTQNLVGMLLGAAAGIASGRADVGQAVAAGGSQFGTRNFLQFSRSQESEADQAALRLLDATGQSSRGLMQFMEILGEQDLVSARHQDPYVRTHPLTRERVKSIGHHTGTSPHGDAPVEPEFVAMHARMRAKLVGFLEPFSITMRLYPESDTTVAGRYARAVAYYRKGSLDTALELVNGLIAEHPNDPYFLELKGQMLFEGGRVAESIPPYQSATQILPRAATIQVALARAQIAVGEPAMLDAATEHLRIALREEPRNAFAWRQLAVAYGRQGQEARGGLALAEEALILGKPNEAIYHAKAAEKAFAEGSPEWLNAQDILLAAEHAKKQDDD